MIHLLLLYISRKKADYAPKQWHPPVELSALEQSIVKRIRRAKLFTFLRKVRHELFDEAFQEELAKLYAAQTFMSSPGISSTTGIDHHPTSLHWCF
jgi:hypothetical protein